MDVDELPLPECRGGYPWYQLEEIFSEDEVKQLHGWMYGQTMMLCEGRIWNSTTHEYEEACNGDSHGPVVYPWDLKRWMRGLPIID